MSTKRDEAWLKALSLVPRWLDRVTIDADECWIWPGKSPGRGNYARTIVNLRGKYFSFGLARLVYTAHYGPIPEGMDLDHACHSRSECSGGESCKHRRCINPFHLEPVTHTENVKRSLKNIRRTAGRYPRPQTHCPQGHPYDEENTYVWRGNRKCRACRRARAVA